MLILVNPGIVFISFKYTLFVPSSKKKSTLARPFPSTALNAFFAISFISSFLFSSIFAGIIVFDSGFLYFASKL
jgi:hypothetical protein